jgi:trigger factor
MKVSVVELSPSKKKLQVEVPAQQVQAELDKRYKELAKSARIKGFRPGKVPRHVLKSYYGKSVESEVSNHFVQETYPEALKESNLKPLVEGDVDEITFADSGAFVYEATVEVAPVFEVQGYKGLEVKKPVIAVSDQQIQKDLELMRDRHAQLRALESERPIREGDFAVVAFTPSVDGKVFEKGVAADHMLEVGKGTLHPDFDAHLLGRKVDDQISFDLAYPDNAPTPEIAGKTVRFEVTIKEIKEKNLPELNDEFAKEAQNLETLDELRQDIRARLEKQETDKAEMATRQQFVDKLLELTPLEMPAKAVDHEVDQLLGQLQYQFQSQGLKLDASSFNTPEIRAEYRVQGEKNLRLRLILDQIANQENLSLTEADLEEITGEIARVLRKDVETVKSLHADSQIMEQMKQTRLHDKVWSLLKEHAQYRDATEASEAS